MLEGKLIMLRGSWRGVAIATMVLVMAASHAQSEPERPTVSDAQLDPKLTILGHRLLSSLKNGASGNGEVALLSALSGGIDYLLPSVTENAPDWLKRFEFELEVHENIKPEWSVLTVQPFYESDAFQDTIFTQFSQRRYDKFGESRDVSNIGLGYRRLLLGNAGLIGANGFFDYEWDNHHQRASVGIEAKWAGLDFSANKYFGISSAHTVGSAGAEEEPLDGHDIELTAQLPYLPWARIRGRRYWWQTVEAAEDVKGWSGSIEMDLHQNLQIEGGVVSDNFIKDGNDNEGFVMVRFSMDLGENRPVATSNRMIDSVAWHMRDMKDYRLDKVRRENKIIVERRSSGVVIARGT